MLTGGRHDVSLLLGRPGAQRAGEDRAALVHELAQIDLTAGAAAGGDDHEAAPGGQCGQVSRQVGSTHDVEDDIGAVPVGEVHDRGGEVLVGVGDGQVGTQLAAAG